MLIGYEYSIGRRLQRARFERYVPGLLDWLMDEHVAARPQFVEAHVQAAGGIRQVMQYPEGVEWPNGIAHLVIGLAAQGEEHVQVLSQLADVLQDEVLAKELWTSDDLDFVYGTLTGAATE